MFHVPNKYRIRTGQYGSDERLGNSGVFRIPVKPGVVAACIASDEKWEHVSVHIIGKRNAMTPTWDEMCLVKDMFWDDEDTVVQFHPPKSQYVNDHKNVLHLWRQVGVELPLPPKYFV